MVNISFHSHSLQHKSNQQVVASYSTSLYPNLFKINGLSLVKKPILNDLSKKIANVHNDRMKSLWTLIPSIWTFTIFLNKSFRIVFLLVFMRIFAIATLICASKVYSTKLHRKVDLINFLSGKSSLTRSCASRNYKNCLPQLCHVKISFNKVYIERIKHPSLVHF